MTEKLTLEEKYIKKILNLFDEIDNEKLDEEVENCIRGVSSQVACALRLDANNIENGLEDITDYIWSLDFIEKQDPVKKQKIIDILNEFKEQKKCGFSYENNGVPSFSENENQFNKIPKSPQELVSIYHKHLNIIQVYIIKIEEDFQTLKGMEELISQGFHSSAIKIVKEKIKENFFELKNDKIVINNSTNFIYGLLDIIKKDKNSIYLKKEFRDNIYYQNGDIIAENEINKLNVIIEKTENLLKLLEEKIREDEDAAIIKELQENEEKLGIEEGSIESNYLSELLNLYEGDDKNLVISTLKHLFTRVDNIIGEENIGLNERKKTLRTPLESISIFNPGFLKNNLKAIEILKIIFSLYVNKALESLEQDKFNMIFSIPKRLQEKILYQLRTIVNKYIKSKGESINQTQDLIYIKNKCELFIKKLNGVIPYLLRSIEQREDIAWFRVEYIIPILNELDIPRNLYDDFMTIVDSYNYEKTENLKELAGKDFIIRRRLNIALFNLEEAIKKCEQKDIKYLENAIIYIQTNMPQRIIIDIIKEKEDKKIKTSQTNTSIGKSLAERHMLITKGKSIQQMPKNEIIDTAINELKKQKEQNRSKFGTAKQKNEESLSERNFKDTINSFMESYGKIPDSVKKELRTYIEYFYIFYKSCFLRDQMSVNRIFEENRSFRQE